MLLNWRNVAKTNPQPAISMPEPEPFSENIDTRRRRLLYRACHRGTRELDLLLGSFVKNHGVEFDFHMLERFETLLEHEEVQLQSWLLGDSDIPPSVDKELLLRIIEEQKLHIHAAKSSDEGLSE